MDIQRRLKIDATAWELALITCVGIFWIFFYDFAFSGDLAVSFETGDGYSIGSVCGQEGWYCVATTTPSAYISSVYHTGTQSLHINYGTSTSEYTWWPDDLPASTTLDYYFYPDLTDASVDDQDYIRYDILNNAGSGGWINIHECNYAGASKTCATSTSLKINSTAMICSDMVFNEWHHVEEMYSSATDKLFVRCDDGEWSAELSAYAFDSLEKLHYQPVGNLNDTVEWYFDDYYGATGVEYYPDQGGAVVGVSDGYPNLSKVDAGLSSWTGEVVGRASYSTFLTTESHISFKNSFEVVLWNLDDEDYNVLVGEEYTSSAYDPQILYLETVDYGLYELGTSTSELIATTSIDHHQPMIATKDQDCSRYPYFDNCLYYNTTVATSTYFLASDMEEGKIYWIDATSTYSTLDWIDDSTLIIEDVSGWTKHYIYVGEWNALTEEWEFTGLDDYSIRAGISPDQWAGELATTSGETWYSQNFFLNTIANWLGSVFNFDIGDFSVDIMEILFSPREAVQDLLERFDIREKIPFSYIYEIREIVEDEWENYEDLTATSSNATFSIPFPSGGTVEATFFDLDTVKTDYENQFTTFRTIIEYGLWFTFLFYVLNKINAFSKLTS